MNEIFICETTPREMSRMKWAVFTTFLGREHRKTQGGELATRADDGRGPDKSLERDKKVDTPFPFSPLESF